MMGVETPRAQRAGAGALFLAGGMDAEPGELRLMVEVASASCHCTAVVRPRPSSLTKHSRTNGLDQPRRYTFVLYEQA